MTDDRLTPRWIIETFSPTVGGYDTDPCSSKRQTPIAETEYTKKDDGLTNPWYGDVWLNPPYSDPQPWLKRSIGLYRSGGVDSVMALVKGDTSTDWWQNWITEFDSVLFFDSRIQFDGTGVDAPFPSHMAVVGVPDETIDEMGNHGLVMDIEGKLTLSHF